MTGKNPGLEPAAVRGHCSQPALTKTLTLPILTYLLTLTTSVEIIPRVIQ